MASTLLPLRRNGGVVTYVVDGETYATEKMKKHQDVLSPLTFDLPTKTGYTLAGWSLEEGGDVLDVLQMGNRKITLYGIWMANTCKVTVVLAANQPSCGSTLTVTDYLSGTQYYYGKHLWKSIDSTNGTYSGTWYQSITYAGIVAFQYYETDQYPAAYYVSCGRFTAKTTLYKDTALSTVGLANGSSVNHDSPIGSGDRYTYTYYVPYDVLSL